MYKFVALENFKEIRQPLLETMEANGIKGTLLLAHEGINGTVSGTREGIDALLAYLNSDERINPISAKSLFTMNSRSHQGKTEKEIVTMGVEGIDPRKTDPT